MSSNSTYDSNTFLQQEELIAYIKGEVSAAEKTRIEQIISSNPFMNDAYEGLLQSNLQTIASAEHVIHTRLKKEIKKSKGKSIKTFQNNIWIICLLLILCLIVIAFFLIKNA